MVENRGAPRHRVLKGGAIGFGGGGVDCLVRFGHRGCTGGSHQTGIPERFILVVPGDGLHLPCRIVWRKEHRIGVAFGQAGVS